MEKTIEITEDYASFEIAKLLKRKGFDIPSYASMKVFRGNIYEVNGEWITPKEDAIIPTIQMTMKWLREVHKLFISIQLHMDGSYVWYIYRVDFTPKGCDREPHNYSYEQACEAAIKYCLENLI